MQTVATILCICYRCHALPAFQLILRSEAFTSYQERLARNNAMVHHSEVFSVFSKRPICASTIVRYCLVMSRCCVLRISEYPCTISSMDMLSTSRGSLLSRVIASQ